MEQADEKMEGEMTLVAKALEGDSSAFSRLVLPHQQMVFAMIMRQVGNKEVAEELAQETFIRAFKYLKTYKGKSKFSTWLSQIAINHTRKYFTSKRYKKLKKTEPVSELNIELVDKADQADKKIEDAQTRNCVRQAVASLSPKYREALQLYSFEGMSYKEISETLEIPIGTVSSRINAAVHKLRLELEESR